MTKKILKLNFIVVIILISIITIVTSLFSYNNLLNYNLSYLIGVPLSFMALFMLINTAYTIDEYSNKMMIYVKYLIRYIIYILVLYLSYLNGFNIFLTFLGIFTQKITTILYNLLNKEGD